MGKSFLLRVYLDSLREQGTSLVASTGAAAVLSGGRTFHSFFGLGILEGGLSQTVRRAGQNHGVMQRLRQCHTVIIDEISMISGQALEAANAISKRTRGNTSAWGGLRVVAVGDFYQLPPVGQFGQAADWAFGVPGWSETQFETLTLSEMMRCADEELTQILNLIRIGEVTPEVDAYLDQKITPDRLVNHATRLFPRRQQAEDFNHLRLEELPGKRRIYPTRYSCADSRYLEQIRRSAPIPQELHLKKNALVMLRSNDPEGQWVNGSLGFLREMKAEALTIELRQGAEIRVLPIEFNQLNGEGHVIGSAKNFPVNLAYACTIHKAQGLTLDELHTDLRGVWESGQAYVALSRVRHGTGIYLAGWTKNSVRVDPAVRAFYARCAVGSA